MQYSPAELIQKSFSQDGLTNKEREQVLENDEKLNSEKLLNAQTSISDCFLNAQKNKMTSMQTHEFCLRPDRKGLTSNSVAPFYFWWDDPKEPFFAYYTKKGEFVMTEIDDKTIADRKQTDKELENKIELNRQAQVQAWQNLNSTLANFQTQNNTNQINNQQRINNCIQQNQQNQLNSDGRVTVQMPCN
jgi:hypothetical protein